MQLVHNVFLMRNFNKEFNNEMQFLITFGYIDRNKNWLGKSWWLITIFDFHSSTINILSFITIIMYVIWEITYEIVGGKLFTLFELDPHFVFYDGNKFTNLIYWFCRQIELNQLCALRECIWHKGKHQIWWIQRLFDFKEIFFMFIWWMKFVCKYQA